MVDSEVLPSSDTHVVCLYVEVSLVVYMVGLETIFQKIFIVSIIKDIEIDVLYTVIIMVSIISGGKERVIE